jgi:hypothetical protein
MSITTKVEFEHPVSIRPNKRNVAAASTQLLETVLYC